MPRPITLAIGVEAITTTWEMVSPSLSSQDAIALAKKMSELFAGIAEAGEKDLKEKNNVSG